VTDGSLWTRGGWRFKIGVAAMAMGIGGVALAQFASKSEQRPVEIVALVVGALGAFLAARAARVGGLALIGVYIALVGAGSILSGVHPRPQGVLIGIALGSIIAALSGLLAFIRLGRRSKELDRLMFLESTSIAFFVTMLFVLTYALLEAWINAPKLSMWAVWTVGMLSWAVLSSVFKRRYS